MRSYDKALTVPAVIVGVACVLSGLALRGRAQAGAPVPERVILPPELHDAAEFVNVLQRAGLVVQSVQRSKLEGTFRDGEPAGFITTNLGVVQLVIFKGEMDAEHITITYSKEPGDSACTPPCVPAIHH